MSAIEGFHCINCMKICLLLIADVEASEGTHPEAKKARREPLECRILSNPLGQEYLAWKEKIIKEARAKMKP